ncbi:MAG: LTA synthase family protein [Tissierellia bacterium]|nr:LTA synthase family protein [Tissierellia bacterium]
MIVLSLLIALKTILFINYTEVIHKPVLVFLFTLGIALTCIGLMSSLNEKRKNYYLGIFYTFVSLIMFIDVIYYSYFNALPSVEMIGMMKMLSDVQNSVKSLVTLRSMIFILDLPLVYFYLLKHFINPEILKKLKLDFLLNDKTDLITNKQKLYFSGGMLVVILCTLVIFSSNNLMNTLKYQEFFSYHINDIADFFQDEEASAYQSGVELYGEEDIEILKTRAESLEGPLTGIGKEKNLIVIQVEALQKFVINLTYNDQIITPNLNELIKDSSSIYYDNYFQLLGRGNTSDAEFVSNNSLHPSMESPTYTQYENNTFYGLPWILRENGYTAWAFHGYEKDFWNRDKAYKNQGFENFVSQEDYEVGDIIELGITDEDFFEQSMEYLKELKESENPFYAFMVTLSSHNPFTMPEEYKELEILPEHKNTILGDYFQSIHYADKALGKFLKDLKSEGIYEDSIIAIYGDHFAIPNHNKKDVDLMSNYLGKNYYFDDIMNVPLIIHIPNSDVGYTNSKVGSQLDFFPTILNIMGYDNKKGIIFGVDLENYKGYQSVKPQTIMRKGSFIDDNYVFHMASTELFEDSILRDRKTGRDIQHDTFRENYDEVIWELNLGEYILRNDILKKVLYDDSTQIKEDHKSHVNDYYIQKLKDNNIDELDRLHKSGKNLMAMPIGYDIYNQIVLLDEDGTLIEELELWGDKNKNAKLLLRIRDMSDEILNQLRYELPSSKSKHIIEINSFEEYYFVKSYGYENILLNCVNTDYTTDELTDFLKAHTTYGVIMTPEDITNEFREENSSCKAHLYIELNNSIQIFN